MSFIEIIKYALRKFIDFNFRKRNPFFWGIKYFSISIVFELAKLASATAIDDFYLLVEQKGGLISYILIWIVFNIILGGITIFFSWLSIFLKLGLIVFFSYLEYKKSTSSLVFRPSKKWFEDLNHKFYTDEIKSKYVDGLHQDLKFKKKELAPITSFDSLNTSSLDLINNIDKSITRFEIDFNEVQKIIRSEIKELPNYRPYKTFPVNLNTQIISIKESFKKNKKALKKTSFKTLKGNNSLTTIPLVSLQYINLKPRKVDDFENWDKEEVIVFQKMIDNYNSIISSLHTLNSDINHINSKSIFIAGNAGVGKTHLSAHLAFELKKENNYPILISAKKFSGINTDLNRTLLNLMDIPSNYQIRDVLVKLNDFAIRKNKRVCFIIDGLNETTDAKIGFNKMWQIQLESFTNQISQFSHLFLICTLRTSYIDRIWQKTPNNLIILNGFNNYDVKEACHLYFNYFNITVTNLEFANLSYFKTPLLLDLFCKLTNGKGENEITIALNTESYIQIFEGYISALKKEVKLNKDFATFAPINEGFEKSATRFLDNNNAICTDEEFIMDFDQNPSVTNDKSIAKAVLEGYLVFIKDCLDGQDSEIIMHTQQEVGGFLLAEKLASDYPTTQDLIDSTIFKEKLVGNDEEKIHQLRFDILKFLVALKPDILLNSNNKHIDRLSWWYLYNSDYGNHDSNMLNHIVSKGSIDSRITNAIEYSSNFWFNKEHPYNFDFIYTILESFPQWDYDMSWCSFIYTNATDIRDTIYDYQDELNKDHDFDIVFLKTKFIITILSSNVRELRDLATSAILEFGIKYPSILLDLSIKSREFKDTYIYERMILCCYGVTLKRQNDDDFVKDFLPLYAEQLFDAQFAQNTEISVYNYIVTDSIKHIIDLSILKGVFNLNTVDKARLDKYQFTLPNPWIEPTQEQQNIVNERSETNPPEPLRMDFGIYTIPRLFDRNVINPKKAIANIWNRIIQMGFEELDLSKDFDEIEKDFHWGNNVYRYRGKVDRLGKKYCWMAFFDYAGKLLLDETLDVWDDGDTSYEAHYERLGDVDIDISKPNKDYVVKEQLFFEDLLKEKRKGNDKWNRIDKTNLIEGLFTQSFDNTNFTLLYGFIDQKEDETYDTRSFLLIESIFIDRTRLDELSSIENNLYDWEDDINASPGYLYDVYFGELYWADSVPKIKKTFESFPTGKFLKDKKRLTKFDLAEEEYKNHKEGDVVEYNRSKKVGVETEPTLMDFRWESNSKLFDSFSEHIPTSNMGKGLDLVVDCETGNIMCSELKTATKYLEFEDDNHFSSRYSYLRADLLKDYMEKNNLALIYQVKQHSYDKSLRHYRKLKFFIHK